MDEAIDGVFQHWADLPPGLQHEVGAAVLYCQRRVQCDGEASGGQVQPAVACNATAAARAACRSLRDGVDGAVTVITATIRELEPGQTQLRLGRFPALAKLGLVITLDDVNVTRSEVQLGDVPSMLQELRVVQRSGCMGLVHAPATPLPCLRVLEMHCVRALAQLDLAHFPVLQRLALRLCRNLTHLHNVHSCPGLKHLDLYSCRACAHGLDAASLLALTQLEHLDLSETAFTSLDVPSCSPSLTHLDLSRSKQPMVDLFLPGRGVRRALKHLALRGKGGGFVRGWDLCAAPNLEVLDVSGHRQLSGGRLDLRHVPMLQQLLAGHAKLQTGDEPQLLGLSAASCLAVLDVQHSGLRELQLQGCAALREIRCSGCVGSLNLSPVSTTLTKLECSQCTAETLDVSDCNQLSSLCCATCPNLHTLHLPVLGAALAVLDVKHCNRLAQLFNLSACTDLRVLDVSHTPLVYLNLVNATVLEHLTAHGCCRLAHLDLPTKCALRCLHLSDTQLRDLDVSTCVHLAHLDAPGIHVVGDRTRIVAGSEKEEEGAGRRAGGDGVVTSGTSG